MAGGPGRDLMDIIITGLGQAVDLDRWVDRPRHSGVEAGPLTGDHQDRYERVVAREAPGDPEEGGAFVALESRILAYQIFPPGLLTPIVREVPLDVGQVVGGQYHLVPGLSLFFASRVSERLARTEAGWFRSGFTYETLEGHPEWGAETFAVEKQLETGDVRVTLTSWSRPGLLLSRLFRPIVRRWQVAASEAALDHLEGIATAVTGEIP